MESGFEVAVALGGPPVAEEMFAGARAIRLPAIRAADERFSALLDEGGSPVAEPLWRARRERLVDAARAFSPDAVLTEHFPFGRRRFTDEILALLAAVKPGRPLVAASVRDVLVASSAPRRREAAALIAAHYHRVLVHGDPRIVAFSESFPEADSIADRLSYTGYVAPARRKQDGPRREIVVSAGSGAVGESLIRLALDARPLSLARNAPWRVILGPVAPEAAFQRLSVSLGRGVLIERERPDLPEILSRAALAIGRAGYNTLVETVSAGARCLIAPFESESETEQPARARAFAARGLAHAVEDSATPAAFAAAIDRALAAPPPDPSAIALDGAAVSARRIAEWLEARR